MQKYQFLEHTADVKFQAFGTSLAEAFVNAALATTRVMTEDVVAQKEKKDIHLEAEKKESLLYDFLEELVFFVDTEGFLVGDVKLRLEKKEGKYHLEATLLGDSAEHYEIATHIKSPTYHEMFIKVEQNKVVVQVVLDI